MLKQPHRYHLLTMTGQRMLRVFIWCGILVSISGCGNFFSICKSNTPSSSDTVDQYPSANAIASPAGAAAPINTHGQFLCPEPFNNDYKKSIAFVSFPRAVPISSRLGALHQVEQHLPMLIGANLRNRHSMLTPTYLRESFGSAKALGGVSAAAQVQAISQQNRVQFFVSGEVDDMTMTFPNTVENPSYFTRFISGAHNLLHINTPLDKRSRVFSFTVEIRDGFTGQIIFSNQYRTYGKWKASPDNQMGFGSPGFWKTDYGIQIQHLVAKASDDMASTINCQPYMARVDSSPGQQQVIIHSGTNNGMHSGDTLDLYQLVYQSISGEYQRFDTRLVKRKGHVYLTEIYPSHSVGHVVDETLLSGQYLVRAR
ncbi:flagella assembly protein FlgT middle domain-containing protein [Cellvibrio sp. OA-2007]|uniref:flagella assembly protein FlgT middle domain-containing protein n=1 Tax=Cellvibrio sp. OA-2007 TaxID=529823 RepID=UPI000785759A|nr:flagella assembly protein FlgT middle domain-containing protein [Cellvibrio sp. OA-2007]